MYYYLCFSLKHYNYSVRDDYGTYFLMPFLRELYKSARFQCGFFWLEDESLSSVGFFDSFG